MTNWSSDWLTAVFFAFAVLNLNGCSSGVRPNSPSQAGSRELTPADARRVLVNFLETQVKGSIAHPDAKIIEEALASTEGIADLRKNTGVADGPNYYLDSGWSYNPTHLAFSKMVGLQGGHAYSVHGEYIKNDNGEWTARIVSIDHLNKGP
jgi:hypothetical protein